MKRKILSSFMLFTMLTPYICSINEVMYAETKNNESEITINGEKSSVNDLLSAESKNSNKKNETKPTADISELLNDQKQESSEEEITPQLNEKKQTLSEEPDEFKQWEEEVTRTEETERETDDSEKNEVEDLLKEEEKTINIVPENKKEETKETEEKRNSRSNERGVATWEAFVADMEAGKDIELTSDIVATSDSVIKLSKSLTISSPEGQRFKIDFAKARIEYQADDIQLTLKNLDFTTAKYGKYTSQPYFVKPSVNGKSQQEFIKSEIILDNSSYETETLKFSSSIDVIIKNKSKFYSKDERTPGNENVGDDISKVTFNTTHSHPMNIDRLEIINSEMDVQSYAFFVSRHNKDNIIRFEDSEVKLITNRGTGNGFSMHMFLIYSKVQFEINRSNVYFNDYLSDGQHKYNNAQNQASIQLIQVNRKEEDVVSGSKIIVDGGSNFLMHGGAVSAFWSAQDDTEFRVTNNSTYKFERFATSSYGRTYPYNHRVANSNFVFSGKTAAVNIENGSKFYLEVDHEKFDSAYGKTDKALASNFYTGDTKLDINITGNSYGSFKNKGMVPNRDDRGGSFYAQAGRYPLQNSGDPSPEKQALTIRIAKDLPPSNPENPPVEDNSSMDVVVEKHAMVDTMANLEIDMNEGAIINWDGDKDGALVRTLNSRFIKMDNVSYFNFINRTKAKTLFGGTNKNGATMESIDNPIASWETGADNSETSVSTMSHPKLDFKMEGNQYETVNEVSQGSGEKFKQYYTTETKGFSNVNRIQMDNFKSIYIPDKSIYPTNQDSKIYLAPMVATEDPDKPRLPNPEEVYASIAILDENKKLIEDVEGGVSNKKTNPPETKYPVYNEEKNITEMISRKSLIEFKPETKLKEGMYVKVTSLQRGLDVGVNGNENEPIKTDIRTIPLLRVQDITPPEPAKIPSKEDDSTKFISKRNKTISGQAEEPSIVTLVKNGIPVDGISAETTGDNNDFTIDLPKDLKAGDKIRVVLEDKSLMDKISVLKDPNEPTSGKKEIEVVKDTPKRSHEFGKGNHNPYPNDKQEGGTDAELDKLRIDYHDATKDKRFKLARVIEVQGMLEFTAPKLLDFGKNIEVAYDEPVKDYPVLDWGDPEGIEDNLAVFDDRTNSENKWKLTVQMNPNSEVNQAPEADVFNQGLKYRNEKGTDQTLEDGVSAVVQDGEKDKNISDTWFKGSRDKETGEVTGNGKKAGFVLSVDANQITDGEHKNELTWTLEDAP